MVGTARGLRRRLPAVLPDLVLAGALVLITAAARRAMVPFVSVSPDSVDPLLRAFQIGGGGGWLPPSHGPQFGPALYWLQLPLVIGADGLRAAFERMLAGQALIALAVYLAVRAAWRGGSDGAWPARLGAFAAALAVATAHGPRLALAHTYEAYQAPELVALATLATVLALVNGRRGPLAAAALLTPLAVMVHPLAVCLVPGLLLAGWHGLRRDGARAVAPAAALAGLAALPGLIQLGRVVVGSGRGFGELTAVARSASGPAGDGGALTAEIVGTFLRPELPPLGPLLVAAPGLALALSTVLARRSGERADRARLWVSAWLVATQLSLLVAALAIGYLRPYHDRIVLAPAAVALGLLVGWIAGAAQRGLASLWPPPPAARAALAALATLALVAVAIVASNLSADRWTERTPRDDDLAVHVRLADTVQREAAGGPRWVEVVSLGGPRSAWGYGPALVLEQRLAGEPAERFSTEGPLFLVVHGPEEEAQRAAAVAAGLGISPHPRGAGDAAPALLLPQLDTPHQGRAFTAALCAELPGARARHDAHEYLSGEADDPDAWFDACLRSGEE